LNVHNELPDELHSIATTILLETGKTYSVEEVTCRLMTELDKERTMDEYLSCIGYMGRQATLILDDERIPATLLSVDEEGGLLVEIDGKTRRLTAAEVSVRI
jgi:biotin-(acetyl-CoA carboxylase) ligase